MISRRISTRCISMIQHDMRRLMPGETPPYPTLRLNNHHDSTTIASAGKV